MLQQIHRVRLLLRRHFCPLTLYLFIFSHLFVSSLYAQILTLTPSLSLSERYDDNIFQTSFDQQDDFVTVVSPGVRLQYVPLADMTLDVDYRADIELFADHSEQNQVAHRGSLQFVSQLTRLLSLSLRDSLVITEEPEDRVIDIDEETGLRSVSEQQRERTIRNRAEATVDLQLAPRTAIGLLFDSLLEDVEIPDEVDTFQYTVGTHLSYLTNVSRGSLARIGYAVTFYTFSENGTVCDDGLDNDGDGATDFPEDTGCENQTDSSEAVDVLSADFQVQTVSVGFRHEFTPTLSGDFSIGYAVTNSEDDPALDNNTDAVTDIRLTKALRTGSLALRYHRRFAAGGGDGGSVLADTFTAVVTARITPNVTARLGGNLSFLDFQRPDDIDRQFWALRPSLTYQVLRYWQMMVDYRFALTDFDDPQEADRTDHRVSFTSRFSLREHSFFDLTYRYASRRFDETDVTDEDIGEIEFDRHEVILSITYAPTFLF